MAKKRKPAKNLSDLRNMLINVLVDAQPDSRTKRVYSWASGPWSSRGPWDADYVDHVFQEVDRALTSTDTSEIERGELRWQRALANWLMGRFEEAVPDAVYAVDVEVQSKRDPRILERMRNSLKAMREAKSPVEAMDSD